MNETMFVVYDKKLGKYRVVDLEKKIISFSSFDEKDDAESLLKDMKDVKKILCKKDSNAL